MKKQKFDAIVIGGGSSGMMAAGRAGERGRDVLLIDGSEILGRKLLISGKGRSNITNAGDIDEHLENFGKTGQFLRDAFSRMFNKDVMDFFEKRKVALIVERGGRVFPKSGRSKDVLDALRTYLKEGSVKVLLKNRVKDIIISNAGEKKVISENGTEYLTSSLAICTGGLSYPETGSRGFGFEIAAKLGHNVLSAEPALVGLVTESHLPKAWQGVTLKNVEVSVVSKGRKKYKRFGDLLFTHFGLSGPVILDISNEIYNLLAGREDVYISINLKPALEKNKLDTRLVRELSRQTNKTLKNVLRELLPNKLIDGFIALSGLKSDVRANQLKRSERGALLASLTDLRFKIKSTRAIKEAIVTKGGVDIKEINPKTMESKLIKGLFFAGEVINVDAKTGGYNMQAAFSTGYLCGDNL